SATNDIEPSNSRMTINKEINKTPTTQDRKWTSSFFPHLRRGPIKTKNDFALIIDISNIQSSFNEIRDGQN
ncbi:13126_t:CDS:1, partial [Gigaspora rosea]